MKEATLENTAVDEKLQRQLALASFFGNQCMAAYQEDLKAMLLGSEDNLQALTKNGVNEKKLADLNFQAGLRKGLQNALSVLESMKSELEERISPDKR